MQLKKQRPSIASLLAVASCSLLNQSASASEDDNNWHVDSALLLYSEKDRVDAVEPVIRATRSFADESSLTVKVAVDTLTGASPSGATISDVPQTFTRPSGRGEYITSAGELPLDDTFKDSRTAVSVQYEFPLDRRTRISTGLAFSNEYDYTSVALNATVARDYNNKNTTVSAGFAYADDSIEPEGEIPIAFASMAPAGSEQPRDRADDDKTTTDLLVGITQVVNRQTLMQLNYSYSRAEGYLTDPFKILSLVASSSGATLDYLYEQRPEERVKHSIYWKTKYHRLNGDTVDVSYRYLWDDWDISSHTVDFRYRIPFAERHYIEPHLRYYSQDQADFYQQFLVAGSPQPRHASADSRLGSYEGITIGAKYGYRFNEDSEFNLRLEYYEQTGDRAHRAIGVGRNYDLFPDLEAVIVQLGYSFSF